MNNFSVRRNSQRTYESVSEEHKYFLLLTLLDFSFPYTTKLSRLY